MGKKTGAVFKAVREVVLCELASVEESDDKAIDERGTMFFDEIESKRISSMNQAMCHPKHGIQAVSFERRKDFVEQESVPKREERVRRVAWRAAIASRERDICTQKDGEGMEVGGACGTFKAHGFLDGLALEYTRLEGFDVLDGLRKERIRMVASETLEKKALAIDFGV